MKERYQKNLGTVNEEEFNIIIDKNILIVGLGGLGGHVLEYLVRFGFNNLAIIDDDTCSTSNLNRQILCTENTLCYFKTDSAIKRAKEINSSINIFANNGRFDSQSSAPIEWADVVIDCVDNIETRLILERICSEHDKVLIHGAVNSYYGQVGIIMPHSNILKTIYSRDNNTDLGNVSFTPGIISGYMVSELVKFLTKSEKSLINKIFFIDLLENTHQVIEF
jgi:molybdopterin/thiamine biosynthesis adenylyltransferase